MRFFVLSVWYGDETGEHSVSVNLGRWNYSADPEGCLLAVAEVALRQARRVAGNKLAPYWPDYWPTLRQASAWVEASDGHHSARACLSLTPFDN